MVLRGRDSLVLLGDSASALRRRDQIADFRLSQERQVGFSGSLSKRALSKGHPHQRGLSCGRMGIDGLRPCFELGDPAACRDVCGTRFAQLLCRCCELISKSANGHREHPCRLRGLCITDTQAMRVVSVYGEGLKGPALPECLISKPCVTRFTYQRAAAR